MKVIAKTLSHSLKALAITVGTTALLQSCGQVRSDFDHVIKVDGSSTVYPITQAIAKAFNTNSKNKFDVDVQVNFSGTGSGFKKFCAGDTYINNASRPISTEEMKACAQNKIPYIELPIAFDAITVVVNPTNTWAESLTLDELKKMWEPAAEGKVTHWNQIKSDWPDQTLSLFGPGTDSGTFDYFTEAVMGKPGASRKDYVFSEDDQALVNGVSQDPKALGYFGYAYYEQNQDKLKAVAIDSGSGPVLPSRKTVESGQYQPLARPLFIYVNAQIAQNYPELRDFVQFYLDQAPKIVTDVGYVPLPEEGYYLAKIHFERGKVGTVFDGKSQFNLTIGELLRQQAKF